jgi:zinc protease
MLRSRHADTLSRERTAFIAGDVDPDTAARAMIARFAAETRSPMEEPEPAEWPDGPRQRIVTRETAQSALCIAFRGPDRNHPDADSLRVMAAAVGGLGGRLFEELRSRRSLAYTVAARPDARLRAGAFIGYLATSPEREDEARSALIEELMSLTENLLPDTDVERAKRYMIGAHQIQIQTTRSRHAELASAILLGAGLEEIRSREERIRAVTPAAIRDAAARWFDPDRIVEGVVRGSGRSR